MTESEERKNVSAEGEIEIDTTATILPRVGEVFPNYISFCKAMGEKPLTSDSKIAQVKRWKSQMKIVTIGRTWRILEVYGKEERERCEGEERRGREKNLNEKISVNQRNKEKTHKGENLSGFLLLRD